MSTAAQHATPNANSTCEWVDERYAAQLWARLLRRRWPSRASLLTVRSAGEVHEFHERGRRFWSACTFAAGPGQTLDAYIAKYSGAGRRLCEFAILRITEHAGQRLFQRLRTNSAEDLTRTVLDALYEVLRHRAARPQNAPQGAEMQLELPWGRFPVVRDGGLWIAVTFIPGDSEAFARSPRQARADRLMTISSINQKLAEGRAKQ